MIIMVISILMSTMNILMMIRMNMRRVGTGIPILVRVRGQECPRHTSTLMGEG